MIERKTISVTQLIIADENVELITVEGINYDVKNSSTEEIILNLNGKDITLESGVVAQVVDGEIAHYIGGEISTVRLTAGEVNSGQIRLDKSGYHDAITDNIHPLQVGASDWNTVIDQNQINTRKVDQESGTYKPETLHMQYKGGDVLIGPPENTSAVTIRGSLNVPIIRLPSGSDASETSSDHPLQIGRSDGYNIRIDNNEIMALSNGTLRAILLTSGAILVQDSRADKNFAVKGKLTATNSSNEIYGARAN